MSLELFNYEDHQVRTVVEDGEPWFVLNDVCSILGIGNSRMVIGRLPEDDVSRADVIDSMGRKQKTTIINEPGLYRVVLRSDKPEADAFMQWVTHDVLPAIRKHGGYMTPAKIEEVLADPDTIIQLATTLKTERAARVELEQKVTEQAPKVEFFDTCVSHDDAMTVKDWGAQFGVGERKARELLVGSNIIYRKFICKRWSEKRQCLVDEYEYRARDGRVTYDWFALRGQHKVQRHHNGQLRQTLYVRGDRALELAKKVGIVAKRDALAVAA